CHDDLYERLARHAMIPCGSVAGGRRLHRYRGLDVRMVLVTHDLEVFEFVVEEGVGTSPDVQLRIRKRGARQLKFDLVEMIGVQVAVASGPDEVADFKITLLRHHVGEQGIARDIEWHTEKNIGAALVELAGQLAVSHIELEEGVARR